MFRKVVAASAAVALVVAPAWAVPLDSYQDFVASGRADAQLVGNQAILVRGAGTRNFYYLEVDPATGRLPVDASITFSQDTNYGVVGANTLRTAAQIGNATGAADFGTGNAGAQTLRVVVASDQPAIAVSGTVEASNFPSTADTDLGAPTANTVRTAAMLGVGSTAVSNANPVPMSDAGGSITVDGTVSASNLPATADTDLGAPGASTIRTAAMLGVGSAAVSNGNPVPMSDAGGSITVDGTVAASNFPATADTDLGAPGASTVRTAAMLGVGSAAVSNGNPVPISDAGGAITVDGTVAASNFPATADTNLGTPGASTVRTAAMIGVGSAAVSTSNPVPTAAVGRSYVTSVRNAYASAAVTTGAWVQLIASTGSAINALTIFDSCGQTLELGTGAAAAESRILIIPPGGIDGQILLNIPLGSRVSVRAVSGNCASGELDITAFS